MKQRIIENVGNPEYLEKLFRENQSDFSRALAELPDDYPSELIRFWKIRLTSGSQVEPGKQAARDLWVVIGLSLITGLLTRLPLLFTGIPMEPFYYRDLAIIVFNGLILYTFWQNKISGLKKILMYSVPAAFLLLYLNILPGRIGDSLILSFIHAPLLLWCLFGLAFVSFDYKNTVKLTGFIRFNGELLVMTGLILVAGGILTGLAIGLFSVIKLEIFKFCYDYVAFFSCSAAPIVSFYLIRKFPGITSKITPVLARVFTPMVLGTLAVYLVSLIVSGSSILRNRELLIVFNGMLLAVTAIIVFSISELDKTKEKNSHVLVLFLLAIMALAINAIALFAIASRISTGITPNRVVVLVSNILIFLNLVLVSKDLYRAYFKKGNPNAVETTVAKYLTVYAAWTVIVIFILPLVFGFR